MLAVGLLTPLAAAGVIGVMVVAIYTSHLKVGFFVFLPNQGWEYCATIALGALAVGTMGPGEWSLDNAIDFSLSGWGALIVTLALGVGGAAVHLATSYRPVKKS
jgi:putative oxidoreductase